MTDQPRARADEPFNLSTEDHAEIELIVKKALRHLRLNSHQNAARAASRSKVDR